MSPELNEAIQAYMMALVTAGIDTAEAIKALEFAQKAWHEGYEDASGVAMKSLEKCTQ